MGRERLQPFDRRVRRLGPQNIGDKEQGLPLPTVAMSEYDTDEALWGLGENRRGAKEMRLQRFLNWRDGV